MPWLLTGGIASDYYGEPRMTQDIVMVIDNAQVLAAQHSFLQCLEESDFIFDPDAVREGHTRRYGEDTWSRPSHSGPGRRIARREGFL